MPLAGQIVRASDISATQYVRKAATESVTSSTTIQDDDDLFIALPVGRWRIELRLTAGGATGPGGSDIRLAWANTGSMSTLSRSCLGPGATTSDTADGAANSTGRSSAAEVVYGLSGTTTQGKVWEELLVDVTVAGTLRLRWAQGSSSGTATTVSTSSHLLVTPAEEA